MLHSSKKTRLIQQECSCARMVSLSAGRRSGLVSARWSERWNGVECYRGYFKFACLHHDGARSPPNFQRQGTHRCSNGHFVRYFIVKSWFLQYNNGWKINNTTGEVEYNVLQVSKFNLGIIKWTCMTMNHSIHMLRYPLIPILRPPWIC